MSQGDWGGAKKDNPFSQEFLSNMKKNQINSKERKILYIIHKGIRFLYEKLLINPKI